MQVLRQAANDEEMDLLVDQSQQNLLQELIKLQRDFGLKVMQSAQGTVSVRHLNEREHASRPLTPEFESLFALENHVKQHSVDILHAYLFEKDTASHSPT